MGRWFLDEHWTGGYPGEQLFQNRSKTLTKKLPTDCIFYHFKRHPHRRPYFLIEAVFCPPGNVTCSPGSPLGDGLSQEAAADLGLETGTAVGASLIDAHAGGLGITSETCF